MSIKEEKMMTANMSSAFESNVEAKMDGDGVKNCDSPDVPGTPAFTKKPSISVTENLLRYYECSICVEPLACAVMLQCGHNFSYACIADYFTNSQEKRCPSCQSTEVDLAKGVLNRLAENTVHELLVQRGVEGEGHLHLSWQHSGGW
eukprot:gene26470-31992_t